MIISAIYYEPGNFQQQLSDLKSTEKNHTARLQTAVTWFSFCSASGQHFPLIESKTETKMCDVSVFATIGVTGVFQPQYTGHLQRKKKVWESHPSGMSGGSKSHRQSLIEVWSALQLDCGLKKGGWGCDVFAAQLSIYTASIWGGGNRPPRTP